MNKKGNERFILFIVAILVLYVAILQFIIQNGYMALTPLPALVYVVVYTTAIFGLILSYFALIDDNIFIKGVRIILMIGLAFFYILPYLDNLSADWASKVIAFPTMAVYFGLLTGILLLIDAIRVIPSE